MSAYEITGVYKNGDEYASGELDIFELAEHLHELAGETATNREGWIERSEHPMPLSLKVQFVSDA